ncbi:MAG: CHASE2 and HATPase_c domain-containing protein [Candidatus Obscuribacterales bacterium]|nr:CHASE2 and HATPase_c domain-containing protein [Candidatus Obscuribacterales bacterium]
MKPTTKSEQSRTPITLRLALSFFLCSFASAALLQCTGVFARNEAQNINRFFEIRRWIKWAPSSLAKLNPSSIWLYHQNHEFPRHIWNWDYTLSWLIADNHPPITQKIVIFNHLNEDDAPAAAALKHPWLKPLLSRNIPRSIYADWLQLLARSGARAIILDNEFPQYTADDTKLARMIANINNGSTSGKSVPVLFARTVNCRTQGNVVGQIVSSSNGLLDELEKTDHKNIGKSVSNYYTGSVGVLEDEDQIVRRLATRIDSQFQTIESIPLAVLDRLQVLNSSTERQIPDQLLIDFSSGANSEYYPIRPLTYLLNPELRDRLTKKPETKENEDVDVKDAIVIIGDGISDIFNTSTTNLGVDVMSGPEILANGIDTLSRRSWFKIPSALESLAYVFAVSLFGAATILLTKLIEYRQLATSKKPLIYWFADLLAVSFLVAFSILVPAFAFAYAYIVLPVLSTFAAFLLASIVTTLLERDYLREQTFQEQLNNEKEKITLIQKNHEQEMAAEAARARVREIEVDQSRRAEFVKRLRHDILGPASSINWTLLRLQKEEVTERVRERFQVLMRNSETLTNLIDELTRVYTVKTVGDNNLLDEPDKIEQTIDVNQFLVQCAKSQQSLAEEKTGSITIIDSPEAIVAVVDSVKLSRIISNLIRNSFLHNQPKTNVVIEAKKEADCLKLLIHDDGQGIAPEKIEQIFEDGITTGHEDSQHQGLGLGIVKTLVTELGGTISVDSKPNRGTTFQITFLDGSLLFQSQEKKSA